MRFHARLLNSAPPVVTWAPCAVVLVPIVLAAARAASGSWIPSGDDAYFTVRSRDVGTSNHPLLGAWSSGSVDLDNPINNLGPLQLDLLAPFTRLWPMGGTAIGVAATNVAAIVAIAWLVSRIAGRASVLPAMVAVSLLVWTMGSEMLITPRQHQYLLLPYLCLLVAAWAITVGDRWAIVVAVVAASLVAQTHLSYPVLVAGLASTVVAALALSSRMGEPAIAERRKPLVIAIVLAVVLWSQTLFEQIFRSGNLVDVAFGSGEAGRAGFATGWRIVSGVLVSTATLIRPGYRRFDEQAPLANWWQSAVFGATLVAAMILVARTWRAGDWRRAAGPAIATAAVITSIVDAALLPRTVFGLTIMNYRWLWPTATFILMLAGIAIWTRLAAATARADAPGRIQWAAFGAAALACVVPAGHNLRASIQLQDANRYVTEQARVAFVLDQLEDAQLSGPIVIDESGMYFGHPYTYPVLVVLQQGDVDFRFESPLQARRFGAARVADGSERAVLRLLSGGEAQRANELGTAIAFVGEARPVAIVVEEGP